MPSYRHQVPGNLYIHFDVKFPDTVGTENAEGVRELSGFDFQALQRILPPPAPPQAVPDDAMHDTLVLEDLQPEEEAARSRAAMEEDDDDMHAGAERVQCASQ
jgi:DnaJ family protein A protein 2